jgi:beta-alanine degradation protein BauB
MKKYHPLVIFLFLLITTDTALAQITTRTPEFSNSKAKAWKTVIYPSSKNALKMHRHEHDRVLVALNSGRLKITNDQGATHYLKLKKHHAYYLPKDPPHELHQDENITKHPIQVFVIELKEST